MAPCLGEIFSIKRLLASLAAILFGFLIFNGLTSITLPPTKLVIIHSLFEVASIIIGFIIFYITWYGTSTSNSLRVTIVSLVIISAAMMELVHMLDYLGFAVDSVSTDHIWVTAWIFSRLIWSFGFLYAASLPPNGNNYQLFSHKTLLYFTLTVIIALIANIIFSDNLTYLNINSYDQPLTLAAQYAALIADLLALIILRRKQPDHVGNLLQFALLFGAFSDFSFVLAVHTPHSLNVAGHFFKVIANLFVLRWLYIPVIRQPYTEVLQLKEEMEELANNNDRLYRDSEHQRNLVEDFLAKIGMIISSQLDVRGTLEAIADMVADMMRSRQSAIALFSKNLSSLEVVATYGFGAPPDSIPLENSLAGQVWKAKTVLFIDDLALHPEIFRPQLIFANIRSIICAPLVNDQEIIGVIEAYSNEKGMFTKRDALLLKALGYHAGAAITSAQQYEQTKMRLDEEQFLYQIAQASAASIDTDTILEQCTAHATRALNADIGLGFLVNEPQKSFVCKTSVGLNSHPKNFSLDTFPKVVEIVNRLTPTITAVEDLPLLKELCDEGPNGPIMILPLPVDHRLMGTIIIGWSRFVNPERLQRTSFAALMAQQIALGLEKANLYNQVRAMALSDALTGLANRRNFDMFLSTELRRSATLKRPLSLIMLDLDKFKVYNDTYGHPIGDKLLTQLGKLLQQAVRSIDFPARYGGEEFCIILPECSNREATVLAEKIRQMVEAGQYPDDVGTFTARITASLGVATYEPSQHAHPPANDHFVTAADKALFQAKNQGRNRVVNSDAL